MLAEVPKHPSSSYIWCRLLYVFDFWNTRCMRLVTSSSHSLTGVNELSSGSGVASLNHWRAGLVAPDIMPAPRVRSARVPVLS